jgi:hypothetical protein
VVTGLATCVAVAAGGLVALAPAEARAVPTCHGQRATIVGSGTVRGTSGPDVIVGSKGADSIEGRGGADVICGLGGPDTIKGGAGADWVEGGGGNDLVYGGKGNDRIAGQAGSDRLIGGAGDDKVSGGAGVDICAVGPGKDRLRSCNETVPDLPPSAVADRATLTEDAPATAIDVLANDLDADGGLKLIQSVTQPAHGTVAITATGVTYEPAHDYCNDGAPTDDFTYALAPGGSSATVQVGVTCVDDAPVAVDDAATVGEDVPDPVEIDVLGNDNDPDAGPRSVSSVTHRRTGPW